MNPNQNKTDTRSPKVDWMENERVQEAISVMCLDGDKDSVNNLCRIVAEEATKDRRKWISVDEMLPEEGQAVWIVLYNGDIEKEPVWFNSDADAFIAWYYKEYLSESGRPLVGATHWCYRYEDTPPPFTKRP